MVPPGTAAVHGYWSQAHWNDVYADDAGHGAGQSAAAIARSVTAMAERLSGGRPFRRTLDIAAGSGMLGHALAQRGGEVIVTDLSALAISLAKCRAPSNRNLHYCVMDASMLALGPAMVDLATCVRSLWCFADPASCLAEARRVLRPDGWIVVQIWAEPADCRFIGLGAALLSRYIPALQRSSDTAGPFTFRRETLATLLSDCGFADVVIERHDVLPPCGSTAEYWREFAGVAETAYRAMMSQSDAVRAKIDRHCQAMLHEAHTREMELRLTWYLCAARSR